MRKLDSSIFNKNNMPIEQKSYFCGAQSHWEKTYWEKILIYYCRCNITMYLLENISKLYLDLFSKYNQLLIRFVCAEMKGWLRVV